MHPELLPPGPYSPLRTYIDHLQQVKHAEAIRDGVDAVTRFRIRPIVEPRRDSVDGVIRNSISPTVEPRRDGVTAVTRRIV